MTENGNERKRILDEWRRRIGRADEERPPEFLSSRMGTRKVSFGALLERIVADFNDEHQDDSAVLLDADTETEKLKLLLATVDYVLSVESISLASEEKAVIMRRAYAEIFGYGPLDALFADHTITTILIEGADRISVRRGHGELETRSAVFDDESHLRRIIARLLRDAGANFDPDEPIMEVGLAIEGRPIAVNLALPPVTLQISADIRVHPPELPTLSALVEAGVISQKASLLLDAIARSQNGFVIVGDTESGKTTLMSILAQLTDTKSLIAVERSGELRLPEGAERLVVQWKSEQSRLFSERVAEAVSSAPQAIILDEVRADEPEAIVPLLAGETAIRQMWIFRGPADTKRLTAALGMLARRADPAQGEVLLQSLYRKLPFVIGVRRFKGEIQLRSIAEWQFADDSMYPNLVELVSSDGVVVSGQRVLNELDLPDNYFA